MFRSTAAGTAAAASGGGMLQAGGVGEAGHGAAFQYPDSFASSSISLPAAAAAAVPPGMAGAGVTQYSTRRGQSKYPFRLNFYEIPPHHGLEITIEEFETWALDRLRVLAEIESCQARNKTYPEMLKHMGEHLKKHIPLSANTAQSINHYAEREKDYISHYVLRLAFCRSEELRRRFVKAETLLFKLRLDSDDARERDAFLETLQLDWKPVPEEEKERLKGKLLSATPWIRKNWAGERFYGVPWTKVLDLVEKRRVYMEAGLAFVPAAEQSSLVLAEFSSRLEKQMELTARHIPRRLDLDEEERLLPILEHLSMGLLVGLSSGSYASGSNALFGAHGEKSGKLSWDMVDGLVKRHAPMCMRSLQETLNEKHHLKHFARLQYNLFLKELGLPIEEALIFWRRSFSLITDDKFTKEYAYNVKHGYGLVGGRKNYPAKSCASILTQNQPGPQDTHGCPFRHMSESNLQASLWNQYGVGAGEAGDIMQAVQGGHYHIACTRLFEITHKKKERGGVRKGEGIAPGGETVTHPNRYFERSYVIEKHARDEGLGGDEDEEMHAGPGGAGAGTSAASAAMAAVGAVMENPGEEEQEGAEAAPLPTFSQESFGDDLMAHLDEQMLLALESGSKKAASSAEQGDATAGEESVVPRASEELNAQEKEGVSEAQDVSEMQQEEQPAERQESVQATPPSLEQEPQVSEQPSVADDAQAREAIVDHVGKAEEQGATQEQVQEQADVLMEE